MSKVNVEESKQFIIGTLVHQTNALAILPSCVEILRMVWKHVSARLLVRMYETWRKYLTWNLLYVVCALSHVKMEA